MELPCQYKNFGPDGVMAHKELLCMLKSWHPNKAPLGKPYGAGTSPD